MYAKRLRKCSPRSRIRERSTSSSSLQATFRLSRLPDASKYDEANFPLTFLSFAAAHAHFEHSVYDRGCVIDSHQTPANISNSHPIVQCRCNYRGVARDIL